jgi:NAD(P)-dependent dehydrogenase (short-subunit alcohol dehydrogenase family)
MIERKTKRVIVITGAGRGIGRATAQSFAASKQNGQGNDEVHLVLAARSQTELESTAELVHSAGSSATVVACDVTAEPHVKRLIEVAGALTGTIDVVVCSAGTAAVAPLTELSLAEWEQTLRVTLTGTFLVCKHAVQHMQPGGHVFTLSSIAGRSGFPNWSAYSAAKFGVLGFSEAIRAELRPRGIRVTAVIPGAVDTSLWDTVPGEWNRANMLQPEDVARAIVRANAEPPHVSVDELVIGHIAGAL